MRDIARWLNDPAGHHGQQIAVRLTFYLLATLGVAFALTGTGTIYAISVGHNNTSTLDQRSTQRDQERDAFERQLQAQTVQAADDRKHDHQAICNALGESIVKAQATGKVVPQTTLDFVKNFGCQDAG